ncbi:hypothetical protein, partial [Rathayibacter rathayi]|uniref:hypothetical protein n=1 Tax=Rathayibacter rathayi TaxID=33887 RepID=UPI001CA5DA96
ADFAKPLITNPSRTTSALDWLKNHLGAGGVTVSNAMDSVKQGVNGGGDLVPTAHQALMDQLLRVGIKVSPEKVVTIMTTPEGKIVWLERGTTGDVTPNPSGLAHIIEAHGDEFAQKGISESQIPDLLSRAIQENKIVGYQGKRTGRPIYEVEYNGETMKIAITIGSNGYIVGANIR